MLKERLKNYEQIEKELDQAIIQASEGGATTSELGQALANTIAHAPTTAKRRIQQSLILSNKLLSKQKELDTLNEKLKEKDQEIEKQAEEIKMYKRLNEKTSQPYSYLATGIEKAEKELYLAEKENKNKDQIIQNFKKEIEVLRNSKKQLEQDLNKILSKRQNIETLQATLHKLLQMSPTEKIDVQTLKQTLADSLIGPLEATKTVPKKKKQQDTSGEKVPLWYSKLKQTAK